MRRRKKRKVRVPRGRKPRRFLVFCGLVALFLAALVFPLELRLWLLRGELARLEERRKELLKERAEIQELLRYYASDAYVEEAARRELGLVRPGEALVLPGIPGEVQPPPDPGKLYKD